MKLFITDVETADKSTVCEIAATLYRIGDSERETGAIASVSTLLHIYQNDYEEINGITPELAKSFTPSCAPYSAVEFLQKMMEESDYYVAFNSEFDAPLVENLLDFTTGLSKKSGSGWLCAMKDFNWGYPNSNKYGSYKLSDLALWMGIGISTVHRAGDDVRLLVECFNRRRSVLPEMLEVAIARSQSPTIELQALVSYDDRHLAKSAGFIWDDKPGRRCWHKQIRECDAENFIRGCSFEVVKSLVSP